MTNEERELLEPFPVERRTRALEALRAPESGVREMPTNPNPRVRSHALTHFRAAPRQLVVVSTALARLEDRDRWARLH